MEKDALSAGVSKVGGLFSTAEIKILVCYILSALNAPVPGRMLADVLHYEGIANCFEVNDAIAALCESGHLKPADEKDDTYVITDNGRQIADTLKTLCRLPLRTARTRRRLKWYRAFATLRRALPKYRTRTVKHILPAPLRTTASRL